MFFHFSQPCHIIWGSIFSPAFLVPLVLLIQMLDFLDVVQNFWISFLWCIIVFILLSALTFPPEPSILSCAPCHRQGNVTELMTGCLATFSITEVLNTESESMLAQPGKFLAEMCPVPRVLALLNLIAAALGSRTHNPCSLAPSVFCITARVNKLKMWLTKTVLRLRP